MEKLQGLRPCNFQGNSWKSGGGNYKLHIMGKLQGLRPCNFQWNSWKLGTSISFLLWENCRGFAPAIFRGTLGNWGHPLAYHYGKIAGASPLQFSGELLETGVSIISDIGTAGYPDKEREQTKMLNWAQSEVFNWAPAETLPAILLEP